MIKIKKPTKKVILILLPCFTVVILAVVYFKISDSKNTEKTIYGPNTEEPVNYSPPTEQEKKETSNNKDSFFKQQQEAKTQQKPTPTNKTPVTPIITSSEVTSSSVNVNAYVPGIFEDGGTCTAVFTSGSQSVTKSTVGVKEGSNVYCPLITAPLSEFPTKGSWALRLSYSSIYANGMSTLKEVSL